MIIVFTKVNAVTKLTRLRRTLHKVTIDKLGGVYHAVFKTSINV